MKTANDRSRMWIVGYALLALPLLACGDDGGDDVTDDVPTVDMGRDETDMGGGETDMGGGETDMGGGETDMGGGETVAPTITMVEWSHVAGCSGGTRSDVTVTVTVEDPDTDAADLTFSGMASGCTGSIDGATSTVSCPQAAPYTSMVTVTDPEGGSDMASFTIGVCSNGSLEP